MANNEEKKESREKDCGRLHFTIEDAISHARERLGGNDFEP